MVFQAQGLELVLACVKTEGDSGDVLNICNVLECQGEWEAEEEGEDDEEEEEECIVFRESYSMERGG